MIIIMQINLSESVKAKTLLEALALYMSCQSSCLHQEGFKMWVKKVVVRSDKPSRKKLMCVHKPLDVLAKSSPAMFPLFWARWRWENDAVRLITHAQCQGCLYFYLTYCQLNFICCTVVVLISVVQIIAGADLEFLKGGLFSLLVSWPHPKPHPFPFFYL